MQNQSEWNMKVNSHRRLLEYMEEKFPRWIIVPPAGILGSFFNEDLEAMATDRYLDKKDITSYVPGNSKSRIIEHHYRMATRGFTELAELRNKDRNKIAIGISVIALIVSITGLLFQYFSHRP